MARAVIRWLTTYAELVQANRWLRKDLKAMQVEFRKCQEARQQLEAELRVQREGDGVEGELWGVPVVADENLRPGERVFTGPERVEHDCPYRAALRAVAALDPQVIKDYPNLPINMANQALINIATQ